MQKIHKNIIILFISAVLLCAIGSWAIVNGTGARAERITSSTDSAGGSVTPSATFECAGTDTPQCETRNARGATANVGLFGGTEEFSGIVDWQSY